jgi:hypothetical protein
MTDSYSSSMPIFLRSLSGNSNLSVLLQDFLVQLINSNLGIPIILSIHRIGQKLLILKVL